MGGKLLIAGFPAEAFGTNCYVVAAAAGEQCLVVDPGIGVLDQLDDVLAKYRLQPAAVLLTHGHLDHTFSVTPVCGARGVPAYVHPRDRELLADPAKGLSRDLTQLFGGRLDWSEPDDVRELTSGATLDLVGVQVRVEHAPGHTGGSVMFRAGDPEVTLNGRPVDFDELCFTGDVLFAGSIGRTDLPGGDLGEMLESLRTKVLPLPDATLVLPGHGPATTIRRERATNPYLLQVAAGADAAGPNRGW